MLYSAEALVAAAFTTGAVNTQITALNTALSTTATALGSVTNGFVAEPNDATSFPALVYWVGASANPGEYRRFGKRDTRIGLRLLYLSRHATLATAKTDIQVAMEALVTVLETLQGLQHGATGRYCVDVQDFEVSLVEYPVSNEIVRQGGVLTATLVMRTEGV